MSTVVLFAAALLQVGVPAAETPDPAYLDTVAAVMVAGARTASMVDNERIASYRVTGRQRTVIGLRVLRRDRPVYRAETVARLIWRRDGPEEAEILGARQAIPIVRRGMLAPDEGDLNDVLDLAFDPAEPMLLRIIENDDVAEDDADHDEDDYEPIHPLAIGSEAHYRFRSGETTTIRLADGRTIRLLELEILPRRSIPTLLNGSLWLDAATYAPVRGVFTLAAPMRISAEPAGGWIPLPVPDAVFSIRHLLIEYALWENRWWMPSLVTFEGTAEVGGVSGMLTFERAYEDYEIVADGQDPMPSLAFDTLRHVLLDTDCDDDDDDCMADLVFIPRDTAELLTSPHLPASIYSDEGRLADTRTLDELASLIDASSIRGLATRRPNIDWVPIAGSLLRYNRVEGLTLGTLASVRLDPLELTGAAWIGLADRSPSAALSVMRSRYGGAETIEVYRRLEAFTPGDRPFGLGNSFAAFAFGRDEGDYYRATGVALHSEHWLSRRVEFSLRSYFERQSAVAKETDASIRNWLGDDWLFRDNPEADEGRQLGSEAALRLTAGMNPDRVRATTTLTAHGETGTHRFARLRADLQTLVPVGKVAAGIEAAAGTSFGSVPLQRMWQLGSASTVRGFDARDRVAGTAFWTARAEVGTRGPAVRIVLFGDAGWAGERGDFQADPSLISAGVGFSALDGLIRFDVARALRGGSGWAAYARLDGVL